MKVQGNNGAIRFLKEKDSSEKKLVTRNLTWYPIKIQTFFFSSWIYAFIEKFIISIEIYIEKLKTTNSKPFNQSIRKSLFIFPIF